MEDAQMAVGKVTISAINKLQGWLWCSALTGFGARRQTNGVFYYVRYRHNGRQTLKSIGKHGPWTPDTARAKALHVLAQVAGGDDPYAQALASDGFATAAERYLERKRTSLKPATLRETERYLRDHSRPLHSLRLEQIDRRKIAALLGDIETGSGPIARNRARSALSAMFAWCIQEGLLDTNPVAGTGKASEGNGRERVLTQEELRTLWRSLGDDPFSDVVRLLLLTGQRRTEIGNLRWSEIDHARKMIVLPASRVKNGREHSVPLSAQALAIINGVPRRNTTDYLWGERGFIHWERAKAALDQRLPLAPWTLHDCRRTFATMAAELGVQPHIVEACLNHLSGHKSGVAGIYNRASYVDPMRDALQRWADHLDKITA
jgi:integrase